MNYISVSQAAEKWNLSPRRVQKLCAEHRVPGVERVGRAWLIPKGARKPADARKRSEPARPAGGSE